MGTTVPAALANLADGLALRANLTGVAIHTFDIEGGLWTDSQAIVFQQVNAPQSWSVMAEPGRDETAVLAGYNFNELAGNSEADVRTARARAGVLLDELAAQLAADPDLGGAVPEEFGPPLLTTVTWVTWQAEINQVSIWRVRVDWQVTWSAAV